jgi:hypothetical protein
MSRIKIWKCFPSIVLSVKTLFFFKAIIVEFIQQNVHGLSNQPHVGQYSDE